MGDTWFYHPWRTLFHQTCGRTCFACRLPPNALLTARSCEQAVIYGAGRCTVSHRWEAKCGGYHGLFESKKFQRHFPGVSDFRVICVCPSDTWRYSLRPAVAKKSGYERWLFATRSALDGASFLCGNVFLGCTGEAKSLLRPPAPAGSGNPEGGGGVARILTG